MAKRLKYRKRQTMASLRWRDWLPRRRYRLLGAVDAADEMPERLPRRGVVVVQAEGPPTWVAFDCPCDRRHRLLMPLGVGPGNRWRLTGSAHPTLRPSVDSFDAGERCHFFLTQGRIHWAGIRPDARSET